MHKKTVIIQQIEWTTSLYIVTEIEQIILQKD